jgi:hypothetical protein
VSARDAAPALAHAAMVPCVYCNGTGTKAEHVAPGVVEPYPCAYCKGSRERVGLHPGPIAGCCTIDRLHDVEGE